MRRTTAITIAAAMLFGKAAWAAEQPRSAIIGLIDATAYEALAPQPGYLVRQPDNTALSRDIAAFLEAELARRHIDTDAMADYILSFRIDSDPAAIVDRAPGIELRGSVGSSGNDDDFDDVQVLLRTQLFDPRRGGRSHTRILILTVTDRANRLIWEGRATAATASADDAAIARALAPHLLDRIGAAAYQERVP